MKYRPDFHYLVVHFCGGYMERKYGNNDFSNEQDQIFHDVKPRVVCNGDVVVWTIKKI